MVKFSAVFALISGGAGSFGPGTGWSYKPRYSSSALDRSERRQNHRHTQRPNGRTGNSLGAHCSQRNLLQAALGTESEKVACACKTMPAFSVQAGCILSAIADSFILCKSCPYTIHITECKKDKNNL